MTKLKVGLNNFCWSVSTCIYYFNKPLYVNMHISPDAEMDDVLEEAGVKTVGVLCI